LKEILAKLGLTDLRFGKEKNDDKISNDKNYRTAYEKRKNSFNFSNNRAANNGKRLNISILFQE